MTLSVLVVAVAVQSAALSVIMAGAWVVQQRTGNSGWVDTVWTFGLGLVGAAAALWTFASQDAHFRQFIVAGLLTVWALRLGLHIATRTAGISDDPRYAELIRGWGADARRQMLWLLQKQALVTIPLAMSILLAAHNPQQGWRAQDWLGISILFIAIAGEAVADRHLKQFRSNPAHRGQVCDVGLWRWSRHPNYFFEWLGWLAYPAIAIDLSGGYAVGWLALAGPICMYWLLAYVSGVPPLEAHMLRSRGDAYRAYQARTSAFFPAPPRSAPGGARV